jgi:hypothetical protein
MLKSLHINRLHTSIPLRPTHIHLTTSRTHPSHYVLRLVRRIHCLSLDPLHEAEGVGMLKPLHINPPHAHPSHYVLRLVRRIHCLQLDPLHEAEGVGMLKSLHINPPAHIHLTTSSGSSGGSTAYRWTLCMKQRA